MTLFLALLAGGAQIASPADVPAYEGADNPQGTLVISTDDLDLVDAADRKRLDRRIAGAAAKICRGLSITSTLREQSECTSRAIQKVQGQREALIARAFYARTRESNGAGAANRAMGLRDGDGAGFR